jgi:mannose-1-phosphate guanylyltransferase
MDLPFDRRERAAVLLAGGDGVRLSDLTHKILSRHVPKQFCPLVGTTTPLEQTRRRLSLTVPSSSTMVAVRRAHEPLYGPFLSDLSSRNLVVQPANRGTAPAILYALLRLAEIDAGLDVVVMPSDHYVDDDAAFMDHVELAFKTVNERPELTILLGIAPDEAETAYGWIEPAQPVSPEHAPVARVLRFWEKPSRRVAENLLARGCLWNSFVMVARVSTLLGLFMIAMPDLYTSFSALRASLGSIHERRLAEALYLNLHATDFSQQVLSRFPINLSVLPVCGVAWSDLGEPRRVFDTLSRLGLRPSWAAA